MNILSSPSRLERVLETDITPIFFMSRRVYDALLEAKVEISTYLHSTKLSARFKGEVSYLSDVLSTTLQLGESYLTSTKDLPLIDVKDIETSTNSFLTHEYGENNDTSFVSQQLEPSIGLDDDSNGGEKYYEIIPYNAGSGNHLLVIVEKGFLSVTTESKENLSEFYSGLFAALTKHNHHDYVKVNVIQNYLRNQKNEDLLTRIKVSSRSPI